MVFRKVQVPLSKPLDDYSIKLGSEGVGTDSGDVRILEQAHDEFIAGSFSVGDPNPGRYYLMAKYEVTELQYQSVQSDKCPQPATKLLVPQSSISWFDAVSFADKYNLWLRKSSTDRIPKEDGILGFVRLPTESEWEYAARGGLNTMPTDFRESVFPMPDKGIGNYVWFGGAQSSNGKVQLVGRLEPNPLGLHDMLGNVDEMIFEPFRLTKLNRLHGQAGGYIVRGANYLTPQSDVRTSWRQEQTYYRNDEGSQSRQKTTGFRLVLVAPTITSPKRIKDLENEFDKLGADDTPAKSDQASRPSATERLGSLLSGVADSKLKAQLQNVQTELRESNQLRDEQRDIAIHAVLRFGSFLCARVGDEVRQLELQKKRFSDICETQSPNPDLCPSITRGLAARQDSHDITASSYADSIVEAARIYKVEQIEPQIAVVRQQFSSRDKGNLSAYLEMYWSQLSKNMKSHIISRSAWLDECKSVVQPGVKK